MQFRLESQRMMDTVKASPKNSVTNSASESATRRLPARVGVVVKDPVFVERRAQQIYDLPIVHGVGVLQYREKFVLEDPVYQVIFVPEVIIEALPVHVAQLTDVAHVDLGEGTVGHQLFHGAGQGALGHI